MSDQATQGERLAVLETLARTTGETLAEIRSELRGMRADLRAIDERTIRLEERMATKNFVLATVLGGFALLAALSAFHEQITGTIAFRCGCYKELAGVHNIRENHLGRAEATEQHRQARL